MTVESAITVLRARWGEVSLLLGGRSSQVAGDLSALAAAAPGSPAHVDLTARISAAILSLPARHPAREALLTRRARFVPAPGGAEPATTYDVDDDVRRRLLGTPALPPGQVARGGHDPADRGLLRLTDPRGAERLPAFQFDADGRPHDVVLAVNYLLDAYSDPWGVADWWLGPNALLGAVPAEHVGTSADAAIIESARDVLAED